MRKHIHLHTDRQRTDIKYTVKDSYVMYIGIVESEIFCFKHTGRDSPRQTYSQTNRQTCNQTDRQTDILLDRLLDKHTSS